MKDNVKFIVIILAIAVILIVSNVFTATSGMYRQLGEINSDIISIQNNMDNLRSDMENFQVKVQEELKSQGSLLSSYNISYDNGNPETLTGDIIIEVVPKEYSEDTTATVTLGDKVAAMEREGSIFTAVISVPVDIIYSELIVDFKSGSSIKSEVVAPGEIGFVNVLSNDVNVDFYGEGSKSVNNKYGYHGQIQVYMPEVDMTLSEVRLLAIKNNEVIWETEDFYHNEEEGNYTTEINKSFSLEKEDRLHLAVEMKDSYGFKFKIPVYSTEINQNDGVTGASENMTPEVLDAEGKVIVFKNY